MSLQIFFFLPHHVACGILSSSTGDRTCAPFSGSRVLITGQPGKSLSLQIFKVTCVIPDKGMMKTCCCCFFTTRICFCGGNILNSFLCFHNFTLCLPRQIISSVLNVFIFKKHFIPPNFLLENRISSHPSMPLDTSLGLLAAEKKTVRARIISTFPLF